MKSLQHNTRISNGYAACLLIIGLLQATLLSAQSTVAGLRFNNQNVTSAKVNVLTPGNGGNKAEIKTGDKFTSGTRLIIPPNTIVLLQTVGGKQKLESVTKQVMEYTVDITAKGENHTVKGYGASLENTVNKVVGHDYKANNGRGTTAASHGTVFTFTDYTQGGKEQAKIKTDEGTISIIDARPVKINGTVDKKHARTITESVSNKQSAGDDAYTTNDNVINYDSPEQALEALSRTIGKYAVDDESADNLTALADIYMEMEQYDKAIAPYRSAFQYYSAAYGQDDLTTLEIELALADALLSTAAENKQSEGEQLANHAMSLLEEELGYSQDDLDYVIQENDAVAEELICEDISDIYDLIGYGYDILGDEANSTLYYDKSDKGCE